MIESDRTMEVDPIDVVPAEFNKVIVCMYGGQGGAGANAPFTYTAGTKVKPS